MTAMGDQGVGSIEVREQFCEGLLGLADHLSNCGHKGQSLIVWNKCTQIACTMGLRSEADVPA